MLAFEGLDNNHVPAAARAWRTDVVRLDLHIGAGGRRHPEQLANVAEHHLAGGTGEQTIVAYAVKAPGQDV